jgi:FtsP/CotA-like multicopper oxidase with cupredoxin domain
VTLRIARVQLEVAPGRFISTVGYNGAVPGPLIRFKEGVATTVEMFNETPVSELVHWHGFLLPADLDGAAEEGSSEVPAHGRLRYRLTPYPSGFRYVHTHAMAMSNLNRGTFSGQFGFVWIEPRNNPGRYDQEIYLATHEWSPHLTHNEEEQDSSPLPQTPPPDMESAQAHGWEVAYRYFTINGKCLGFGEPIRVKEGQRVLFHVLNASATESVRLSLPGHQFLVVALDGNPVPHPQRVETLELGVAERLDAVVEMNFPGSFVLGSPNDSHRGKGLGIVVEYANRSGPPQWVKPRNSLWDYTIFGENHPVSEPDVVLPLIFRQTNNSKSGFEQWTINGNCYDDRTKPTRLAQGRQYCFVFDNQSDDVHPVHLHRNSFELIDVGGVSTAGIWKDVVMVKNRQQVKVNLGPLQPGLSLFHCHQQLHMDNGFKILFEVT